MSESLEVEIPVASTRIPEKEITSQGSQTLALRVREHAFLSRIALIGSTAFLSLGFALAADQGPISVSASVDSAPTGTATATIISTPNPTISAEQTKTADLEKKLNEAKALVDQKTKQAELQDKIDGLNGTPTKTPTPTNSPTATPTLTQDQIAIKMAAGLLPTYTATPFPTRTPNPVLEGTGNSDGGSNKDRNSDWAYIVGSILGLGGLLRLVMSRKAIIRLKQKYFPSKKPPKQPDREEDSPEGDDNRPL